MTTLTTKNTLQNRHVHRKKRRSKMMLLLVLFLLLLSSLALFLGNTIYSPKVVMQVLLGQSVKGASFAIGTLRLPRLLAALMVGMAFGISGNTFQTMLRNPLASPDIIGVTSGTSVAALFCILVLQISGPIVSFISVVCGISVALIIYFLSKGGGFSGGRLILIGIGIQAMLSAVISYLLLKASQYDISAAMRWLSGSLNGIRMNEIPFLAFVLFLCSGIILLLEKQLLMLELGEQTAITLGISTNQVRILLVISAVFLIAFSTAITGPISFVSFLSGPIATRFVGSGTPKSLASGLIGAILVLAADLIGQFAFDVKFPVGIITGMIGSPYLIFLLIRMNKTGGAV